MWLSLWGGKRGRTADAERTGAIDRCFTELAHRRGLTLRRHPPLQHPIGGAIPIAPQLEGLLDGFALTLAIEGDHANSGDQLTVVRVHARDGAPDWPAIAKPCRQRQSVPGSAHAALDRLCAASNRVELGPRTLVVEPKVAATIDWDGNALRIETDVDRLDAYLALALALARSL